MSALAPPQFTPAVLPGALPMVDGMMPMQVDGGWIDNASGLGVGEHVTPGRSPTCGRLQWRSWTAPAFGMRPAAHLPTPQSPGNPAFFAPAMTFRFIDSSSVCFASTHQSTRTMLQPQQQQFPVIADPATLQNRIPLQSGMTEPQAFMTPESSPVYSRRPVRSQNESPHLGSNAASLLSSPFTPRPISQAGESQTHPSQPRPAGMSAPSEPRTLSSPLSRGMTPSSNLGSPFGGHRLSVADRSKSKARTPARSHAPTPTPITAHHAPAQPSEAATEVTPTQTPPPLSAPVPQRPLGGEIERIKAQLIVDHATLLSETEARRPDYLVRAQRPSSGQIIEPLDLEEPEGHPGLGVTVTPMRGRRIQLAAGGGYPGYGSSMVADPQTPVANKANNGLSQRALHWLQQATPGQPGPSNMPVEPEADWIPSEKEILKRKRLAAFEEDRDPNDHTCKLHPVRLRAKGACSLMSQLQAQLQSPVKKRPNPRRRRRGHRRGRGGSPGDDDELDGRKEILRMAKEERLKWIENYLDRDSDSTSEDEGGHTDQALQPAVDSHDDDEVYPIRRGRGKMVPLKANPEARDPADARAALLSKRSVRALAERRRKRDEDEESSDEVNCPCGRGENGKPCVQCDDCKCWFHLRCMGIRSEAELGGDDDPWYCPDCLGVYPSDPSSEPTFVPTDSELPRDGIRDPLLYQGSPRTPYTTRERGEVYESRSSWNSSGAGPVTPLSTERDIGVYKTPAFDSPFNPADTPSRGGKLSGPFNTPWMESGWHFSPRQRSIFKTGGIHEIVGDAQREVTLTAYNAGRSIAPLDDTPVLRNMSREDISFMGRRLWPSPSSGSPRGSLRRTSLQDGSAAALREAKM
ncbi:uncharacterized protein B0H18DRAFT_1021375 [Fomitopsis serialis]|uniref:uncharacterized protein n=1 Tax=Fomitopsis serialis TaxID=139415 RepID=UPI002007EA5C|nr:uncharacterized protein B0H18DRAFT_1021375 [Neoantrodia serialis]KAH9921305.1 hypothetical protein B0H18DRAFT_1021375 [Neoantrodia serialis]